MTHYEKIAQYLGCKVRIYDGRVVLITGYGVPGSAFCIDIDGRSPGIHEVCTAFLQPENLAPSWPQGETK